MGVYSQALVKQVNTFVDCMEKCTSKLVFRELIAWMQWLKNSIEVRIWSFIEDTTSKLTRHNFNGGVYDMVQTTFKFLCRLANSTMLMPI
jgi:hypothetical protein